ncbi:MAG: AMP-binding protein, partial [bacterium]|nr:AMP-binding protein [bacterium]
MLIEKFEEQVKRNPKKTALKGESKTLSYEELNSYSNTIALEIKRISPPREKGGEGNHRVTLLFDHGVEMITAILAVLKAGYIYITLSTDYPERRHSYVIADSGASLIVTDAKNMAVAAKLARENNIEALDIDTLDKTAETQNPEREITHDDIAYIMYTSGSTGKP